ncbi:hypothetical protein K3552_04125 [Leisingera aquaemixtae]|uniref:hypothetical protein n=1 Tax=Leisingera aquaemixtae TaxID=1396826 RepID=UPI0021A6887A|nr:hypothetical protein [Leisingera aquaemixtae]UWQ38204.1 hypothetical protein K3552_04125 [Leisingera aquaemixtae]
MLDSRSESLTRFVQQRLQQELAAPVGAEFHTSGRDAQVTAGRRRVRFALRLPQAGSSCFPQYFLQGKFCYGEEHLMLRLLFDRYQPGIRGQEKLGLTDLSPGKMGF